MEVQGSRSSNINDGTDIERQEGPPSRFCEKRCASYLCGCAGTDIILLVLAIPFVIIVQPIGLVLAAIAPGAAILYFSYRHYHEQVTVGQMALCCGEIMLWMIPLLLWDLIWVLAISPEMKQDGLCSICVLAYAVQSYFFAGFCEELIKYFAINRLRDSVMTADWRSFAVYGVCVGCGFAIAENILYTLSSGYGTAIVRAFTAVPFHCTTGCLQGLGIAKRRHMQLDVPWWRVMLVPWLLHGTYDFILMVGGASESDLGILGVIGIIIIIIGGLCYARYEAMQLSAHGNLDGSKMLSIHDAIVEVDEISGERRTQVLGHPSIAMWCQSTMCVCDCCCTLWCGCCKSSSDHLPPPSARAHPNQLQQSNQGNRNNQQQTAHRAGQSDTGYHNVMSPVHHHNDDDADSSQDVRTVQPVGVPVFNDNGAHHNV